LAKNEGNRAQLAARDLELLIHSHTEGSLEIRDRLVASGDGRGVKTLAYVLHPAAPLFSLTVAGEGAGGFGLASAAKSGDVSRAVDFLPDLVPSPPAAVSDSRSGGYRRSLPRGLHQRGYSVRSGRT